MKHRYTLWQHSSGWRALLPAEHPGYDGCRVVREFEAKSMFDALEQLCKQQAKEVRNDHAVDRTQHRDG